MKKLGLLISMILCVIIGGVYATWTYTQSTDVAVEQIHMSMNLTDVAYAGSYGTYKIDTSTLKMTIDPEEGTTHTTALTIKGQITITFTPNSVAPQEVKNNAVPSTFRLSLSNPNWLYEGKPIVTLEHDTAETIVWGDPDTNGVFSYVISASELAEHIHLTKFVLDTKAKYDAFNALLGQGNITITVSDGVSAQN